MKVGELFVNLGVKGSEKTIGAITGVQRGLKDTASNALLAKASIVAALYSLERLMSWTGQTGTALTNMSTAMGLATDTLQRYQYAARQANVSNEELTTTLYGLQQTMTKIRAGEPPPRSWAIFGHALGLSPEDINEFAKKPEMLLQAAAKFSQIKELDIGFRNKTLGDMGFSPGMIAAMVRGKFDDQILKKAIIYSEKEVASLDRAYIAWQNLGHKLQMAFGRFNARYGGDLIKDLDQIAVSMIGATEAFIKFADTVNAARWISDMFKGWGLIFGGMETTIDKINKMIGSEKEREETKKDASNFFTNDLPNYFKDTFSTFKDAEWDDRLKILLGHSAGAPAKWIFERMFSNADATSLSGKPNASDKSVIDWFKKTFGEDVGPLSAKAFASAMFENQALKAITQTPITITQSFTFTGDGANAKEVSDSWKKEIREAVNQTSSRAGGP